MYLVENAGDCGIVKGIALGGSMPLKQPTIQNGSATFFFKLLKLIPILSI